MSDTAVPDTLRAKAYELLDLTIAKHARAFEQDRIFRIREEEVHATSAALVAAAYAVSVLEPGCADPPPSLQRPKKNR